MTICLKLVFILYNSNERGWLGISLTQFSIQLTFIFVVMDYFKIMVTGKADNIIWDLEAEDNISICHPVYEYLSKEIELLNWKTKYLDLYSRWLDIGDDSIYNINHPINMDMIQTISNINVKNKSIKVYYWFDVDRDIYPNFVWEKCPLSQDTLVLLPHNFNSNNWKISTKFPLVFPNCGN